MFCTNVGKGTIAPVAYIFEVVFLYFLFGTCDDKSLVSVVFIVWFLRRPFISGMTTVCSRVLRVLLCTCAWWRCDVLPPVRIALKHELDTQVVRGDASPDVFAMCAMAVCSCLLLVFVRR